MTRLPLLGLGDSLLRLVQVNVRFCNNLGRVTGEFLRDVVATLEEPYAANGETRQQGSNGASRTPAAAPPAPAPAHPPAPRASSQTITLLEAEAGNWAVGAFTILNHFDYEIVARPQTSGFFDPPGTTAVPRLVFEPEAVTLAPHEQVLVRMMGGIDQSLQPEVRYRCEVTVPALPGSQIPVVIRRKPDRPKPVPEPAPAPAASAAERRPSDDKSNHKVVRRPTRRGKRSKKSR
jgi:hypothetical protein